MAQRALITGISGFAGGYLAAHLLQHGDRVLGITPDGKWHRHSDVNLHHQVELVAWDLGRRGGLPEESQQQIEAFAPDVIYHLAAISIPKECGEQKPSDFALAINVLGTRRVLRLACALPRRPKVLVVSSSHVYAPVDPQQPVVDEQAPLGPVTAYGTTKLAAEREVARAVAAEGVEAVIARAFPHTGPRQTVPLMLPQWASQLAANSGKPIRVHTLDAAIDLCDVRDVVRAYRLLVQEGRGGEVFNVGSGVSRRSGDVFELLCRFAGPAGKVVETMPGKRQDPIADIAKITDRTGWTPAVPLEITVSDTLAWWRAWVRQRAEQ